MRLPGKTGQRSRWEGEKRRQDGQETVDGHRRERQPDCSPSAVTYHRHTVGAVRSKGARCGDEVSPLELIMADCPPQREAIPVRESETGIRDHPAGSQPVGEAGERSAATLYG